MSSSERTPGAPLRTVAITFDDLPFITVVGHDVPTRRRSTERLLAGLAVHGIPTTAFVNAYAVEPAGRIEDARVDLLRLWRDAGHDLANHTFAHSDLHQVGAAAFEADIVRGEPLVRELMAARGREPRWFRHPYLHAGTDLATGRRIEAFLGERGCRVAPVTIDPEDFLFAAALDRMNVRANERAAAQVAAAYVPHLEAHFEYHEWLSQQLFGREVPQILLLHANTINAETIGDLAGMLRKRGYAFVSLEQALADPAYAEPDPFVGGFAQGWLHRLAHARGQADLLRPGAPKVPGFVRARAELGPMRKLWRSLERRALAAKRSAKTVLRAVGVLPPKRRRPAA